MSEFSFVITTALTVFFAGLLSWILIIYVNYQLSKQVSAFVKGKTGWVYLFISLFSLVGAYFQLVLINFLANLFTGFGLGYAVGFGVGACAVGAVGSASISAYLFKNAHRSKAA